jgi:23S rRNA (cytidine1920-2'-O)/16S rRNA (cytidine1409-2'-O)-methyltransferase
LKPEDFATKFDLAVMDVSFISATKVLPAIVPLLREGGAIVTLIKPQFEVGRGEVGGGGVVRDASKRARVVEEVNAAARALGMNVVNVIESPIAGAEGNIEFLALYKLV